MQMVPLFTVATFLFLSLYVQFGWLTSVLLTGTIVLGLGAAATWAHNQPALERVLRDWTKAMMAAVTVAVAMVLFNNIIGVPLFAKLWQRDMTIVPLELALLVVSLALAYGLWWGNAATQRAILTVSVALSIVLALYQSAGYDRPQVWGKWAKDEVPGLNLASAYLTKASAASELRATDVTTSAKHQWGVAKTQVVVYSDQLEKVTDLPRGEIVYREEVQPQGNGPHRVKVRTKNANGDFMTPGHTGWVDMDLFIWSVERPGLPGSSDAATAAHRSEVVPSSGPAAPRTPVTKTVSFKPGQLVSSGIPMFPGDFIAYSGMSAPFKVPRDFERGEFMVVDQPLSFYAQSAGELRIVGADRAGSVTITLTPTQGSKPVEEKGWIASLF